MSARKILASMMRSRWPQCHSYFTCHPYSHLSLLCKCLLWKSKYFFLCFQWILDKNWAHNKASAMLDLGTPMRCSLDEGIITVSSWKWSPSMNWLELWGVWYLYECVLLLLPLSSNELQSCHLFYTWHFVGRSRWLTNQQLIEYATISSTP